MRMSRKLSRVAVTVVLAMLASATPALAESHPFQSSFGSFSNPNGIAVDESTGDVYVADIGADAVYKFDASGNPVSFSALGSNVLTGASTPQSSFSFHSEEGNPAAIAVDNSTNAGDPSAGDLYVMDAADQVVDKFSSSGESLGQISAHLAGTRLLGLGVDERGALRVYAERGYETYVQHFDDAAANAWVQSLRWEESVGSPAQGFAVAPSGDMYLLATCGCLQKSGGYAEPLGLVDNGPSDVAVAVDPITGHVYADDQSSVAEWDAGAMNGYMHHKIFEHVGSGAAVSTFGSTQLEGNSSGQGGIGVNGKAGEIYVSSPADGKVYVFGTSPPGVAAGDASGMSRTTGTLNGAIDPRRKAVTSCRFEYEVGGSELYLGQPYLTVPAVTYHHTAPCKQSPAEIGSGDSPVAVSAEVGGLHVGQLYDFRLVAENANGASFADGRFASEGPGFGFKGFEVAFLNEDGTPDTQAGSHPYEMLTSIELNTHVIPREKDADSLYVTYPDGYVRDILTELPPGLIGDPNATAKKCTVAELEAGGQLGIPLCPPESQVGELEAVFGGEYLDPAKTEAAVYNMVAPHGVAVQLGTNLTIPNAFIDAGVRAGGDYPVRAVSLDIPHPVPLVTTRLKIFGVVGSGESRKPFLTLPTGCAGPLKSTLSVDSYENPGRFVEGAALTRDSAGQRVSLTGCSKLRFPPTITVAPDTTNASTASGLTVGVHVPQKSAFNPDGLAESALRDTTVTLPEGVAINPSGADGLEACSEGLAGFTGFNEFNPEFEPGMQTATFTPEMPSPLAPGANFCPNGSKIGTVQITTPLLSKPIEGAVYLAAQNQNPFGSLVAMYLVAEDPASGTLIKLAGEVGLSGTGQIVTTFKNTPDLPFEDLTLHFFGGERAPLTTPARCGTYTTEAVFTPWDGNPPVRTSSSFTIDHGPGGGPCPGATLPFDPELTAGTVNNQAGAFSPFTLTMSRQDGDQDLQSIDLHLPPGLMGTLVGVKLCGEAQANSGTCGPESLIGETTVSVGVGNDPYTVKGGRVYLTGPYRGAPFGLSIVNPAKAGPYDVEHDTSNPNYQPGCDCLVVRATIEVNPLTAALTSVSDSAGPYKIPTILDGIPLQIKHVNIMLNRPSFTFNPTNCKKLTITGALHSAEGSTSEVSVPMQVANCAKLAFKPSFKVSTSGKTSRINGASLDVKLRMPKAPFGTQANIAKVKVQLPRQLPSRLPTIQQACPDHVFEANPASCPRSSRVGSAQAVTPVLPVPLEGPAYFVGHGGAKFPELIVVLQGYGVTVMLHGETFIGEKSGVTSSTFRTVPDVPVGTFELRLPKGRYSALGANANLCKVKGGLKMPTVLVAQNGRQLRQTTKVKVTGCAAHKAKRRKHHKRRKGRK